MVETRVIDIASDDTIIVNKLSGLSVASKAVVDRKDIKEELLFLFLKQLVSPSNKELLHELWIGVGAVIEIADKVLVVRYLTRNPDIAIVGHSLHKPQSAIAVLTDSHKNEAIQFLRTVFQKPQNPGVQIDKLVYDVLKRVRSRICPVAGCLFARDTDERKLCEMCDRARNDRSTRLFRADGLCLRCGDEAAPAPDRPYCMKCLRTEVREFVRNENPELRSLSDRGTDQIGRPVRDLNALAGSPDMSSTDENE